MKMQQRFLLIALLIAILGHTALAYEDEVDVDDDDWDDDVADSDQDWEPEEDGDDGDYEPEEDYFDETYNDGNEIADYRTHVS